ncbi:MAG: hypothetical protein KDI51_02235 [Xanthomonadales bacterium]|nr:hypothetical protein [Xanthomonadales bacterium]
MNKPLDRSVNSNVREEGVFSAFGINLLVRRSLLQRHCPETFAPDGPVFRILVRFGTYPLDFERVRSSVIVEPERGGSRRFSARHILDEGSDVYVLRGGAAVEVDRSAKQLTVYVPPETDEGRIGAFCMGIGMTCLLKSLGQLQLHAGIASCEGKTVMLIGASGAGKSSTLAAMQAEGWMVHAEDLAAIRIEQETVTFKPGYNRIRLWLHVVDELRVNGSTAEIAPNGEKVYLPSTRCDSIEGSISHVLLIGDRHQEAVSVCRVSRVKPDAACVAELYANTMTPYLNTREEATQILRECSELTKRLPVMRLTLPDGLRKLRPAVSSLTGVLGMSRSR